MIYKNRETIINILIAVITYILSLGFGIVLGTIILCIGTSWLYIRTKNFWKYSLITTIFNIIISILAGIYFLVEIGIFNTDAWFDGGLGTALGIFLIPCAIIIALLLVLAVNILTVIRLSLQYLCYVLINRYYKKHEKIDWQSLKNVVQY